MDTNRNNEKKFLIEKLYRQLHDNADDYTILLTAQSLVSALQTNSKKTHKGVTILSPGFTTNTSVSGKETITAKNAEPPKSKQEKKKHQHSKLIEKELSFFQIYKEEEKPKNIQQSLFDDVLPTPVELNEKLKKNKQEIGEHQPIKDLKSGIGINDRYLFINELFRGDATTYERSILTINKFDSLKESMDWIERELRLTYFWDEKSKTVQQFLHLIKRRFS